MQGLHVSHYRGGELMMLADTMTIVPLSRSINLA